MKKILLYFGDYQEKKPILETILSDMQIAYRILTDTDLQQPIGYLLGIQDKAQQEVTQTMHMHIDLMFLDGFSDEEIQELNARMKAQGVSMPREAMRTKHNETWRLIDLLEEIEKEHAYFQTLEEIQKLLMASSELQMDIYTPDSWKAYESAFIQAYEVLQNQSEPDVAKAALTTLTQAKAALQKR